MFSLFGECFCKVDSLVVWLIHRTKLGAELSSLPHVPWKSHDSTQYHSSPCFFALTLFNHEVDTIVLYTLDFTYPFTPSFQGRAKMLVQCPWE